MWIYVRVDIILCVCICASVCMCMYVSVCVFEGISFLKLFLTFTTSPLVVVLL